MDKPGKSIKSNKLIRGMAVETRIDRESAHESGAHKTPKHMKTKKAAAAFVLLLSWHMINAAPRELFFAKETEGEYTRVHLSISDDGEVEGSKVWQPDQAHGAAGVLKGKAKGELLHLIYEYEIEGSAQSEEMILKLAGDKLLIGQGELVEGGEELMKLKDPGKVVFEEALAKLPVIEFAAGSPERKAVMEAIRGPISKFAGEPVTFTGKLRSINGWARFSGKASATDGTPPEDEAIAAEMEMDCLAFLKLQADGTWKVMHWGFAGDPMVMDMANEKLTTAPWPLFLW
jgi:hypothetical protein